MGTTYHELTEELITFMTQQPVFFVGTAPLAQEGLVNVSPKGLPTFAVLDPRTVAYLDLTGSGVETIAHLKENGRIVLMFCAFDGPPKILRLYGRGTVLEAGEKGFAELASRFPDNPGTRAVIRVALTRVADSGGFGIPLMRYDRDRDQLPRWAAGKGAEGVAAYIREKNPVSVDGLPGVRPIRST